jgi:Ca2+-binding RTX toxin-like protein
MANVYGTTSSDVLNAADGVTSGDDWVYGDDGNDTIRGLGGHDTLFGDDGRDTLHGAAGNDWLYGGEDNDELHGGEGNDFLFGEDGDDELYGGDNNLDYLEGGAGADLLDGGDGDDTAAYYGSDAGVRVSLAPFLLIGGNSGGDAEGDTLVNIEDLVGSRYMMTSSPGTIKPTCCGAWKATICSMAATGPTPCGVEPAMTTTSSTRPTW